MMFTLRMTALAVALAGICAAQRPEPPSQDQLKTQRAEKMAKEVFKKADWTFDYDKARAESKKSGKPIFAYFTRSYAH
jgi:hypothetical protein